MPAPAKKPGVDGTALDLPDPSKPIPADALIPARYIGDTPVHLSRPQSGSRRFLRADGTPLEAKRIEVEVPSVRGRLRGSNFGKPRTITQVVYMLGPGDTLMMPAGEVLGLTYLHPHESGNGENANLPSYLLGAGWRPLPEDAAEGLDWSPDLRDQPFTPSSGPDTVRSARWVYDYHQGRPDFEPLAPYDDPTLVPVAFRREPSVAAVPAVEETEQPAPASVPDQSDAAPDSAVE